MTYWLASARGGQESGFVKRFSPAYWTVNFPRPMMASVVTTAPDALRVDTVFYGSGDLCGLIWEAVDQWDHPLLAYETKRGTFATASSASAGVRLASARSISSTGRRSPSRAGTRAAARGAGMCGCGTTQWLARPTRRSALDFNTLEWRLPASVRG
jgi:hypothetical protein